MVEMFLYAISAMFTTFAVSGMNLNDLFKQGHIWEARVFLGILIICITHIVEQFLFNIVNIKSQVLHFFSCFGQV